MGPRGGGVAAAVCPDVGHGTARGSEFEFKGVMMHESNPVPVTDRAELLRVARTFPWLPPLEVGAGWAALLWDMAEDLEDLLGRPALLEGRVRLHECRATRTGLRITSGR